MPGCEMGGHRGGQSSLIRPSCGVFHSHTPTYLQQVMGAPSKALAAPAP